jgi:HEAT repeat protein
LRVVLERAREVLPEHRQTLQSFPDALSDPAALGQLLQSLDEAHVHPTEADLGELFRELRPTALMTILQWLPKLSNARVRALLDGSARRLCQAYPDQVVGALKGDDDDVLLATVRLAGQLKLPPVVPGLGSLLQRGSVEVRREAVEALAAIGTAGALKQLELAIDDEDRDVRINGVRHMAKSGHRGAFQRIEAALDGKGLKGADLTERTVFFEAFGTLAGAAGIATLEPLLVQKGFMKKKSDPQIRACAAMALGKIGTPEARELLETAAKDKDPLVRNAANKALRESR